MFFLLILNLIKSQECKDLTPSKVFFPSTQPEGKNAKVRRLIGSSSLRSLDPFLLMDHFFVDPPAGFPDHPHRGFETITYMIRGVCVHEDFNQNHGELHPGDVQWMTAGRGVVHAEMPKTSMEGLQIWLNLHASQKMIPPKYQDFNSSKFPVFESEEMTVKVISGEFEGFKSPIQVNTLAEFFDVEFKKNSFFTREEKSFENWNWIVYSIRGEFWVRETLLKHTHALVLNGDGNTLVLQGHPGSRAILLGGLKLNEHIVQHGPFVMNSHEEIQRAFQDYHQGTNGFEGASNWKSSIYDGVK
jgi:redox-sensitive bicupin YhaK (pirin superfamily)